MKILVTGLCLSRNLGGPAMALALVTELNKRLPSPSYVFAVPAIEYDVEKEWADRYNLATVRHEAYPMRLVEKFKIRQMMSLVGLSKKSFNTNTTFWQTVYNEFMAAIDSSDVVVDLSGISYIGDSGYHFMGGLSSYSNFRYALKRNKPFARFIQTFGPFENAEVRFFAKREFKHLDFIPARGKKSAEMSRQMTSEPGKVYDFPDIAILLPQASETWRDNYLEKKKLSIREYMVVSPSAVIYNFTGITTGCTGESYLKALLRVIEEYLHKNPGKKVLLLPHMYSYIKSESDREGCYKIKAMSDAMPQIKDRVEIVEEDISPLEAKSLIAAAQVSIVSRYHALVASLSSGTPAIAIGWNVKYEDLLEYYDMDEMSLDARTLSQDQLVAKSK